MNFITVYSGEVSFELCSSFLNVWLFILPAAGAYEVPSGKDLGITHINELHLD
jgi:hypothetical protein